MDRSWEASLIRAIIDGEIDTFKDLIINNENRILSDGWTPLLHACHRGRDDIVDLLIQKGADVNLSCKFYTPLMAACASDVDEDTVEKCVNLLLANGANLNDFDCYKSTAFMECCKNGLEKLVNLFLSKGCDINAADTHGYTGLHYAVKGNFIGIVKILLSNGADKYMRTRNDYNALNIAQEKQLDEMIRILRPEEEDPTIGSDYSVHKENPLSAFKKMLVELPLQNSTDGKAGFSSDVKDILCGMELQHLFARLKENKVQLSEFLNAKDGDLRKMGVLLSPHRSTIIENNFRFILEGWSDSSLPYVNGKKKSPVPIREMAIGMANVVKHLHVLWASTIYATNRTIVELPFGSGESLHEIVRSNLCRAQKTVRVLREIKKKAIVKKLNDKMTVVDKIVPTPPKWGSHYKVILLCCVAGIAAWKFCPLKLPKFGN